MAITGPSGAGKSTLLHCMSGIARPDSGSVRFGGIEVTALTDAARSRLRRTEFGLLLQSGQLVPELTAAENIALPLLLEGARKGAAFDRAQSVLDQFGVGELARSRPAQLSGGQVQRVALSRAVVNDPVVLFADEPTGSLDSVSGRQVLDELVTLASTGTAVVLVTHDAQAAGRAHRKIVLQDGVVDGPKR